MLIHKKLPRKIKSNQFQKCLRDNRFIEIYILSIFGQNVAKYYKFNYHFIINFTEEITNMHKIDPMVRKFN